MLSDLEEAFRSRFIVDDGRNELQNSTKQESAFDNSAKTVAVSGGTFSSAVSVDLCAEGCAPVNNGDGTYGVVAGVAQIGTKTYTSLQAAVDATQDGETVQLLSDTTENITINASKQITLDLYGHTLNGGTGTAKAAILNEGTVTITDTSAGKTGTIKRDDQGIEGETSYYVIHNIGTMVIDQVYVVNNSGYWRRRCDSCASYGKQGRKGLRCANQGRGLEEEQKKCRRNMKVPRWMSSSWKTATLLLRLVCLAALALKAVLNRAMGKTPGSNPYSVMLYRTRAC